MFLPSAPSVVHRTDEGKSMPKTCVGSRLHFGFYVELVSIWGQSTVYGTALRMVRIHAGVCFKLFQKRVYMSFRQNTKPIMQGSALLRQMLQCGCSTLWFKAPCALLCDVFDERFTIQLYLLMAYCPFRLHTFGHQTAGNLKTQTMVKALLCCTSSIILCSLYRTFKNK